MVSAVVRVTMVRGMKIIEMVVVVEEVICETGLSDTVHA